MLVSLLLSQYFIRASSLSKLSISIIKKKNIISQVFRPNYFSFSSARSTLSVLGFVPTRQLEPSGPLTLTPDSGPRNSFPFDQTCVHIAHVRYIQLKTTGGENFGGLATIKHPRKPTSPCRKDRSAGGRHILEVSFTQHHRADLDKWLIDTKSTSL